MYLRGGLRGLILWLGCVLAVEGHAASAVSEYDLKAAYIYNFALFTAWPTDKSDDASPMSFCVTGQSPLAGAMEGLKNRKIRDRRIVIREIASPEEGASCHVLYLDASAMSSLVQSVRDTGTLTVSDTSDPLSMEAVINMAVENGKLVFDVNLQNARRAKLTLSSKLLKLARNVH